MTLPTVDVLRALLIYDAESGEFEWKERPPSLCKSAGEWARWNAIYAGTPALTSQNRHGYRHGHILTKPMLAHRVAWAMYVGEWPSGQIDHINGNRADNRITNLRMTGVVGNARNQKVRSSNSSGCMGVSFHRSTGKWRVRINKDGRRVSGGLYASLEEAIRARRALESEEGYHPNHNRTEAERLRDWSLEQESRAA